jgi:tetratricopeptide (TPR) repeat protein
MSNTDKKEDSAVTLEPTLDTEGLLLQRLKNTTSEEEYFRWMLFVVGFYRGINRTESAVELLESFIKTSHDNENLAHCHLALGQIATDEQRIEAALKYFRSALDLQPDKRKVKYVLNNNIGFCLNKLNRFAESEKFCRSAIEIDWSRASAYRNLGLSLEGQHNIVGAAWALGEAVKLEVTDTRARTSLEGLIRANPTLTVQCAWLTGVLAGDAVEVADPVLM